MYTLEYSDGYYIAKDGEGVIDLADPENREFAVFVVDALNAAQQSVQPTIATAALEDSPFETGIRRNAVVLPNRNSG